MAWFQYNLAADGQTGIPAARECHSMVSLDKTIVVFGGNDSAIRYNDVHMLDTCQ
jgi:hypothetical protein